MMKLSKLRIAVVLGCLAYLVSVIALYILVISPVYSYYTFKYVTPHWSTFVANCTLALLPSLWLPVAVRRPSHIACWMLYVFVVLPSCIMPMFALGDRLASGQIFLLSTVVTSSFWIVSAVSQSPVIKLQRPKLAPLTFWLVFGAAISILLAQILVVFGPRLRLVSLFEVYDVRSEFAVTIAETGSFIGYSSGWLTYAVGPTLLALGILKRNLIFTSVGLFVELLMYSVAGFRVSLMIVLLVMGLILLFRFFYPSQLGKVLIWSFVGLVLFSLAVGIALQNAFIPFLLVGRSIMMPGILTGLYYDFFSQGPKAYLSYSIFRTLVEYPYDYLPPSLIGRTYFNSPDTFANASAWADAYANFGYIGMFVFAAVLGMVLWLFDCVTREDNFVLSCILISVYGFVFANSALLTTILTHGVWLALLILALLPHPLKAIQSLGRFHVCMPVLSRKERKKTL